MAESNLPPSELTLVPDAARVLTFSKDTPPKESPKVMFKRAQALRDKAVQELADIALEFKSFPDDPYWGDEWRDWDIRLREKVAEAKVRFLEHVMACIGAALDLDTDARYTEQHAVDIAVGEYRRSRPQVN